MWTAHVTTNRDFPPRPRPGVLHLHPYAYKGADGLKDVADVTAAPAFVAYLAAHPEIGTVIVYDSRFPQRPVAFAKFIEKHARKIWPLAELTAALREHERKRVADPNYTPTVEEALRNPQEFVDGMREE